MMSMAVTIVTGWRLSSVLKPKVGRNGLSVNKDMMLKLDSISISKLFVHQLIQDQVFYIAPVGLKNGTHP